jgi:ABC-type uncharacterized transport system substrate-binding protein
MLNVNELHRALADNGHKITGVSVLSDTQTPATFAQIDGHIVRIDWAKMPEQSDIENAVSAVGAVADAQNAPVILMTTPGAK